MHTLCFGWWWGAAEAMPGAIKATPANARMLAKMSCLVFMVVFLSNGIEECVIHQAPSLNGPSRHSDDIG